MSYISYVYHCYVIIIYYIYTHMTVANSMYVYVCTAVCVVYSYTVV